ncbi:MAG: carbon-nitrogen hydrolase family protein [Bryobacteraceae bacterium]|nr:carbon-nitrogen hydrolase family protein [Bryobacteraceae bacterium]
MRTTRCFCAFALIAGAYGAEVHLPSGTALPWTSGGPREDALPSFRFEPAGGRSKSGALIIETDARDGLDGNWTRTFPVSGGAFYRFAAWRRLRGVEFPSQCAPVTIQWLDATGKRVVDDRMLVERYLKGYDAPAPLEYPGEGATEKSGWTGLSQTLQAPSKAARAVVELHGRWAARSLMEWSDVTFSVSEPPTPRIVRLATIHFRPEAGKTPEDKRKQFAPLIAEAARQKADLVVLPETLTFFNTGLSPAQTAEPVPGPSTEYFAELARRHKIYIVAGLFERDTYKVYNVAVLLSPEGKLAGKYRKVTLPDSEAAAGVIPGRDYPVFQTRFGTLGIMICYDGFFPEVARELTRRGAEIIAWPVWGCNPDLARARAAENHVYLVSSTYEDVTHNWMLSAVWDHSGDTIALAKEWGTVAVAEVNLSDTTRWRSLGDFRSKLAPHAPMTTASPGFTAPKLPLR